MASSGLAISQRAPAPWLGTFVGTCMRTWHAVKSQLKAVRRVLVTTFWKGAVIRTSTNWTSESKLSPDIISSITVR